tara:strand:+ start:31100 stop:31453 length:354 start_codon:yes stop_codon:yes gene_type:complete
MEVYATIEQMDRARGLIWDHPILKATTMLADDVGMRLATAIIGQAVRDGAEYGADLWDAYTPRPHWYAFSIAAAYAQHRQERKLLARVKALNKGYVLTLLLRSYSEYATQCRATYRT